MSVAVAIDNDCDDGDCDQDKDSDDNDDAFTVLHYCSTGKSTVTVITVAAFVTITVIAITVIDSNTKRILSNPINSVYKQHRTSKCLLKPEMQNGRQHKIYSAN